MKTIITALILIFFAFTCVIAQNNEYIQIKTYNENVQPLGNIYIKINNNLEVFIPKKGINYVDINSKNLPVYDIKLLSKNEYEVESWSFTKGILEILFRIKKYKKLLGTLYDNDSQPIEGVKVTLLDTDLSSYSDKDGNFEIIVPNNFPISRKTNFIVDNFNILNKKINGLIVILTLEKIVKPKPKKLKPEKNDAIAEINTTLGIKEKKTKKNEKKEEKKPIINENKEKKNSKEQNINNRNTANYNKLNQINQQSSLTDDVNTFLEETQRSQKSRLEEQELINSKMMLINEKLREGGGLKLSKEERENVLKNIDLLEKLLIENKQKYNDAQEDYRIALITLKNNIENIGILEQQLTEAEVKRNEEREAFIKQLLLLIFIIIICLIIIIIAIYFARKYKNQGHQLAIVNEQVVELNTTLEQRVEQRTKELLETKKELDTFFYRASHDLKRPITSILGISKIADMTLKGEGKELFQQTTKTAVDMNKMLEKLIMVGNINMVDKPNEVALEEALNNNINKFKGIITANKIKVETKIIAKTIFTHPLLLDNLLVCILENALFFTSVCNKKKKLISVTTSNNENNTIIQIIDNGIGIDKEIYPQIEEMFFVGTPMSKGNGLGLYISSKIVKYLGGSLKITSSQNNGCQVDISFPMLKN